MSIRSHRYLLPLLALAGAALTPPAGGQPSSPGETSPPRRWLLSAELTGADGAPLAALDGSELEVRFGGAPARLTGLRAPSDAWQIVVFFDSSQTSDDGLTRAARALAGEAAALARLGSVEVVLADPWAEQLLSPSRRPRDIREALDLAPSEAVGAAELAAGRRTLERHRGAAGLDSQAAAEAYGAELEAIDRQRRELLQWLALAPAAGPRLLLLVSEGFDLDPRAAFRPDNPEALPAGGLAAAQENLAHVLASDGWTVLALAPTPPEPVFGDPRAPLEHLATATGGGVIAELAELPGALQRLARRPLLEVELAGPSGQPAPLEVSCRRPGAAVVAARWAAATTPLEISAARAASALADPERALGELPVAGALRILPPVADAAGEHPTTLELATDLARGRTPPAAHFRVSLLVSQLDEAPRVEHREPPPEDLSAADVWLYRRSLDLPEDLDRMVAVVEELTTGRWGVAAIGAGELPAPRPQARVAVQEDDARAALAPGPAPGAPGAPPATPASSPAPAAPPTPAPAPQPAVTAPAPSPVGIPPAPRVAAEPGVIRLLPLRKQPATGKVRVQTLTSSEAVRRATFYLDGAQAETDERPPFSAVIDLGEGVRPHTLTVVGFTTDGVELGRDEMTLNRSSQPFTVAISRLEVGADGGIDVEAQVAAPAGGTLARVELYANEDLQATLTRPPFRARLRTAGAPRPEDYVRVVAYLADGTSLEDARLLAAPGPVERVEVNLVELYAVVTTRDGQPVRDLTRDDFTVQIGGRPQPLERFALAAEQPLLLGLVIDTSGSMEILMEDTKRAASQFLASTLKEGDRAFLVDFDTKPRLAQATTGDLLTLLRGFARLAPEGFTALYDAMVFSMLQFEDAPGRKALVLLTDGDDYKSQYGPRRAIEYGRKLGVPIYVLALGGIEDPRRGLRKIDLEGITASTGGRVYYISSLDELPGAYAEINNEMRSQYLLAFASERALSQQELDDIEVRVSGKGLSVRAVVGGQRLR